MIYRSIGLSIVQIPGYSHLRPSKLFQLSGSPTASLTQPLYLLANYRSAVYSDRFRTCRLSRYNQKDGMRIIYDADYDYYENLMCKWLEEVLIAGQ